MISTIKTGPLIVAILVAVPCGTAVLVGSLRARNRLQAEILAERESLPRINNRVQLEQGQTQALYRISRAVLVVLVVLALSAR